MIGEVATTAVPDVPDVPAGGTPDRHRGPWARVWSGRRRYLTGAVCIAVCTVMLLPLLASVLASVKPTAEAAQTPPTYVPHGFSLDAYRRLWEYQSGLPTYLFNSFGTAVLTVLLTLVLTTLAGYGLARFPVPFKEPLFVVLLLALIIPYQALLTPIFLMFSDLGLTNSLVGLAIIHTAIQLPFSLYIMRNSFEAVPRELEEAAMIDGANSAPDPAAHLHPRGGARPSSPSPCSPSSRRGTSSSGPS